eukprot:SAG31_NODE_4616_length_3094_cov_1.782638_3_plen_182_part_00
MQLGIREQLICWIAQWGPLSSRAPHSRLHLYWQGAPGSYRSLQHPPDNFEDWYDLVQAMAQHMVDRHGLAEVSSWYWEVNLAQRSPRCASAPEIHCCVKVWNELWGMQYPHPYLDLYNASAMAIKSVHPSLKVGGPATAGLQHVGDFVNDTKSMGIPVVRYTGGAVAPCRLAHKQSQSIGS